VLRELSTATAIPESSKPPPQEGRISQHRVDREGSAAVVLTHFKPNPARSTKHPASFDGLGPNLRLLVQNWPILAQNATCQLMQKISLLRKSNFLGPLEAELYDGRVDLRLIMKSYSKLPWFP